VSSNGGHTVAAAHLGATVVPIVVANATLKRHYTCTVRATNAKGTGPASRASGMITVGAPAQVGRPTITKVAAGRLRVAFTPLTAAQMNGSPLTNPQYTATCRSSNGGVAKAAIGSHSPITVTGLTPNRLYACTVVAHNGRGYSAASTSSLMHAAGVNDTSSPGGAGYRLS
jgi:hypothetical protein